MKNFGTKKGVLWGSLLSISLISLLDILDTASLCPSHHCVNYLKTFFLLIVVFSLCIFLFSLLTYKLPERVFVTWRNFSLWFIPLAIVLIFITPDHGGGMLLPTGREMVSMILPFLYVLISFIIIGVRWHSLRKNQQA